MRCLSAEILAVVGWRCTALIAAQRTALEPCLVMCPRCTTVSDSRWRGVSPAHEHRWAGSVKRCASPTSATNTAASVGPIPGNLLDRLIAVVGAQPLGDHRGEVRFVAVEDVDEFQQRADPLNVGGA